MGIKMVVQWALNIEHSQILNNELDDGTEKTIFMNEWEKYYALWVTGIQAFNCSNIHRNSDAKISFLSFLGSQGTAHRTVFKWKIFQHQWNDSIQIRFWHEIERWNLLFGWKYFIFIEALRCPSFSFWRNFWKKLRINILKTECTRCTFFLLFIKSHLRIY